MKTDGNTSDDRLAARPGPIKGGVQGKSETLDTKTLDAWENSLESDNDLRLNTDIEISSTYEKADMLEYPTLRKPPSLWAKTDWNGGKSGNRD